MSKVGAKIGAALGVLVFATVGILGGIHFGGYGAIMLLAKMGSGGVDPSLFSRMVVVLGMMIGVTSAFSLSVVMGGLLGGLLGPREVVCTNEV